MNKYLNPFQTNQDGSHPFFTNEAKCVREYKGYRAYKILDHAFDIVKDGVCITQRCGHSEALIDRIDAGEDLYTTPQGPRRLVA